MGARFGSLRHKLKRSLEIATIVFLLMLFIALIVVIIMDVNLIFRCRRTGISVNRRVEKTTQPVEKPKVISSFYILLAKFERK